MNILRTSIFLLAVYLLVAAQTFAQTGQEITLFEIESLQPAGDFPVGVMPEYELGREYMTVNPKALRKENLQRGDLLSYRVGQQTHSFRVEQVKSYTEGTFSVLARGLDGFGNHLTLTVEGDRILGSVHLHEFRDLYHMRYDSEQQSNYLARVDSAQLDELECAVHEGHAADETSSTAPRQENRTQPDLPEPQPDEVVTIDLLIAYTPAARNWMQQRSSVNAVIAEAMNRSQQAVEVSDVWVEWNLVHTHLTNYNESGDSGSDMLCKLTASPTFFPNSPSCNQSQHSGFMNEIHDLRDSHGADLVALFVDTQDFGGIAWLLNTTNGLPDWAFSVNRVQQMDFTYTLAHEIGHNMGNHHSRNQNLSPAPAGGGLFEYSTGWRWTGNDGNGYTSVMAYEQEGDERTPHFSNPDISYQGVPTGSYSGQYAPADNARSMNEIRHTIANYRDSGTEPSGPPNTPTLSSPADGSTGLPRNQEMVWNVVADAAEYRVQLSASPDFNNLVINEVQTGTSIRPDSPLNYLTDYYWRVRARNQHGSSDWSTAWTFETIIERPEDVVLSSPEDGAIQVETDAQLNWQPSERAAEYLVQVAEDETFTTLLLQETVTSSQFSGGDVFEPATNYYWRVRASNEGGNSGWSDGWMFTSVVEETLLKANYPNPFRDRTTIPFQLAEQTHVVMEVYDMAGRRVTTLLDEERAPRIYSIEFNGSGYSSGVYILRMRAGDFMDIQRFTLVK